MLLPDAVIVNGDGSDEDLLYEERIGKMDSFVALTILMKKISCFRCSPKRK